MSIFDPENKENMSTLDVPVTPQKKVPVAQPTSATKLPSAKKFMKKTEKISTPIFEDESLTIASSLLDGETRVKKVYKIVQKSTGALGGNGYNGAIYGELTLHSMQKVNLHWRKPSVVNFHI